MTAEIARVFRYHDGQPVRTVAVDGEPWFVAADLAAVLGHRDAHNAVRAVLEDAEKGYAEVRTPGGDQRMLIVSESGLYALIFRSRVVEAKRFRIWVTSEVLPEIRRTGRYAPREQYSLPRTYAAALRELASTVEERDAALAELAVAAPKAEAWQVLASAEGDYSVREAAFALNRDPGISTGQNRLFKTLREMGWIDRRDIPYASHERHIRLRIYSYTDSRTEEKRTAQQVRITADGLRLLHKKLGGTAPLVTLVPADIVPVGAA